MSYISVAFAVFVFLLMILFYAVPQKMRGFLLLLGSIFFYACLGLKYVPFLLFAAVTSYFSARALQRSNKKKAILICCIIVNALVWIAIKKLDWALAVLGRAFSVLGIPVAVPGFNIIVPIGISYFVLQAIGYLIDVTKGKCEAEKSFWKYLLFLSWFPGIVQGPISRYDQLMPQLLNDKKYSFENMRDNLLLILFGLVKKMVIADRLGIFVNACFAGFEDLRGVILYVAAVGYSIQLYTDFSGCVDICRGVSGLFGVELIHNFNRPYLSTSIKDFWGKWHMSLSSWLKDYVYIPLGGNRKGTARKYLNLIITFLVSGFWHGAGFNFMLWGVMHAVYQIVGQSTMGLRGKVKKIIGVKEGSASERIYQTVITFNLVAIAWVIFRAGGLMTGIKYLFNMFSNPALWTLFDGSLFKFGLNQNYVFLLLIHIVVLFVLELCSERQENVISGLTRQHVIIRWIVYIVLIFDVLLFGVYGSGYNVAGFMYGGF